MKTEISRVTENCLFPWFQARRLKSFWWVKRWPHFCYQWWKKQIDEVFGCPYFVWYKWDLPIEQFANEIPYNYGLLRTNSNIKALISIYFGHIHSSGLICGGNSNNCKKLLTLQKRAIRYIVKAKKRDSCKPLFKSLTVFTLISIYILEWALFVNKNNDKFITNTVYHQYIARNYDGLETKTHRTSLFETSPYYSCVKFLTTYQMMTFPMEHLKKNL